MLCVAGIPFLKKIQRIFLVWEESCGGQKAFFLFHPKIILSLEIFRPMCKSLINLLRVQESAGKKANLLFVMPSSKSNHFFPFISSYHSHWVGSVCVCVNNDFVHPHDMTLLLHFFRTETLRYCQSDYFCKLKASL